MPRLLIARGFPGLDRIPRDTVPGLYPVEAGPVESALYDLGWDPEFEDAPGARSFADMQDGAYWLPVLRFDETVTAAEASDTVARLIDTATQDRAVVHMEVQRRRDGGTEKLRGTGSAEQLKGLLRAVAAEG